MGLEARSEKLAILLHRVQTIIRCKDVHPNSINRRHYQHSYVLLQSMFGRWDQNGESLTLW